MSKKTLLAVFPVLAVAALGLWLFDNGAAPMGGFFDNGPDMLLAFGRLAGIVGALGVMGQLLVMTRAPWLEPLTGAALPVKWHHRAGLLIALALLIHPPLVVLHYALQSGNTFMAQYLSVLGWEDVLAAAGGEALIIIAVVLSLPYFRKKMRYGTWYKTHLAVYLGLALAIGHQLELGGDLSAQKPYFAWTWYALLGFTALNAAWYRLNAALKEARMNRKTVLIFLAATAFACAACSGNKGEKPNKRTEKMETDLNLETATLAGGCFWGMQEILGELPGVVKATVGYTGGSTEKPVYEEVTSGKTGHAESIEIQFNPAKLSYGALLDMFFKMHDPTTPNRQANDIGTQYRSAIFYHGDVQKKEAEAAVKRAQESGRWKKPITTEISPAGKFWPAEEYHQDYLKKHPGGYTCHYIRD